MPAETPISPRKERGISFMEDTIDEEDIAEEEKSTDDLKKEPGAHEDERANEGIGYFAIL